MRNLLSVLCVVFSAHYVNSQLSFVESGPSIVKPAQTVDVTCTVTGASLTDSSKIYSVEWIRQYPGKGLEWIGRIIHNGDLYYAQSLKGRVTITRDTSKGKVYLKLSNVNADDSGRYHCSRARITTFDVWGPGTYVTVTAASPSAPSLFPLISCGLSQNPSTTIGCLAKGFLPNTIEFNWTDKANNSYSTGFKKYSSVMQTEGTYAASSQVQVSTDSWKNSDSYYCTAKHPQNTKTVLLQLPHVVARKPTVTIHPPIKEDVEINGNATIACIISDYYPKEIDVKWMKSLDGKPLVAVTEEAGPHADGSFTLTSFITVSKKDWDTDTLFSCIVAHLASDFSEIKNVSKSTVCELPTISGEIKVTAEPPKFETIYFQNTAPLTCIISNMDNKDGLEVSWYSNEEKIPTEIEDPVYDSSSGKYSAKAIASVCPEDWKTKTFECRVSHPELPRVVEVQLKKPNVPLDIVPKVLLYAPHPDELAKKETVTLVCLVSNVYQPDLFIRWMVSDNEEQSQVARTGPIEEITSSSKKTYFFVSTLTLSNVGDWNNGKSFTCVVGHEALPLRTTQRTIDKTAGKPHSVNVTLHMSESC